MRTGPRSLWILAVALLVPAPSRAIDAIFDYAVERVEIQGGYYGYALEEFYDNEGAPLFHPYLGTVTIAGGAMHLTNPGFQYATSATPFVIYASEAMASLVITEGSGNASIQVVWRPAALGRNHYIHATLQSYGTDYGLAGIAFTNFDDTIAPLFSPPQTAGPKMTAHLLHQLLTGDQVPIEIDPVPVDSSLGAVVMQLDYDDTAHTITASYSVDGGARFQHPFPAFPVIGFGSGVGGANLVVGADPYVKPGAPPPPPPVDCSLGLAKVRIRGLGLPLGSQPIALTGRAHTGRTFDPTVESMQLQVFDQQGVLEGDPAGPTIIDFSGSSAVPPALPGCSPRDGWTVHGLKYKYRNRSGAFPPACVPGSAKGLRKLVVGPWKRMADYRLIGMSVAGGSVGGVQGPLSAIMRRGDGTGPDPTQCYTLIDRDLMPCVTVGPIAKCAF